MPPSKTRSLHKRLRDYPEEHFRNSFTRLHVQTPAELMVANSQEHVASNTWESTPRRTSSGGAPTSDPYGTVYQYGDPQFTGDPRANPMDGYYSSYVEGTLLTSSTLQEQPLTEGTQVQDMGTYVSGASLEIELGSDNHPSNCYSNVLQVVGNLQSPIQASSLYPGGQDGYPYDSSDFSSCLGQGTRDDLLHPAYGGLNSHTTNDYALHIVGQSSDPSNSGRTYRPADSVRGDTSSSFSGLEVSPLMLSSPIPGETMQYGYDIPVDGIDAEGASSISPSNNPEDMRQRRIEHLESGVSWYSGNAN